MKDMPLQGNNKTRRGYHQDGPLLLCIPLPCCFFLLLSPSDVVFTTNLVYTLTLLLLLSYTFLLSL